MSGLKEAIEKLEKADGILTSPKNNIWHWPTKVVDAYVEMKKALTILKGMQKPECKTCKGFKDKYCVQTGTMIPCPDCQPEPNKYKHANWCNPKPWENECQCGVLQRANQPEPKAEEFVKKCRKLLASDTSTLFETEIALEEANKIIKRLQSQLAKQKDDIKFYQQKVAEKISEVNKLEAQLGRARKWANNE